MDKIEISTATIIKTVVIILAVWLLYLIRDVIALVFIAVIIVSVIDPLVDWLQRKKMPRVAGVLLAYLSLFIVLGLAVSFLIPPLASQFSDFARNYPSYFQKTEGILAPINIFFENQHINVSAQNVLDGISSWLSGISQNIFSTTIGVFSGIISTVAVFSIAFYMAMVKDSLKKFVSSVVPDKYETRAVDLTEKIKLKMGKWMQGQIVLMIAVFILVYIGLSIVGVPYALALAALAGLLEIVPYVGPIISAIPGIILGFLISPLTGLFAFLVYVVTQQLENNVLVPLIMKRSVDLSPVVVIIALLVGAKLGGALGAVLAVPIATAANIIIKDFISKDWKEA
jgi:predicted PurR-regulated permease PerM